MFLGDKNYSQHSFAELVEDLTHLVVHALETKKYVKENLEKFNTKVSKTIPSDFQIVVGNTFHLLDLVSEFQKYTEEIKNKNISGYHITKLHDISQTANQLFSKMFQESDPTKNEQWLNFSEDEYLFFQDEIFSELRQVLADFASFGDIATELEKYKTDSVSIQNKVENNSSSQRLIYKDNRGVYYYDGKKIDMEKGKLYSKVFDILFSHSNQEGFLSYEDIETKLVESGEPKIDSKDKRDDRIKNAIDNFFRFAKINNSRLTNKPLNGEVLVGKRRGKGLWINNP